MVNERFSLKGWDFKVWALKNKNNLKLILAGCLGLVASAVSKLPLEWSAPLGIVVAGLSKLAIDTLDFWQSS